MLLTPGTRLGPYTIETLIGWGGMGEVHKAHDERLNRTVAISRPEHPANQSSKFFSGSDLLRSIPLCLSSGISGR